MCGGSTATPGRPPRRPWACWTTKSSEGVLRRPWPLCLGWHPGPRLPWHLPSCLISSYKLRLCPCGSWWTASQRAWASKQACRPPGSRRFSRCPLPLGLPERRASSFAMSLPRSMPSLGPGLCTCCRRKAPVWLTRAPCALTQRATIPRQRPSRRGAGSGLRAAALLWQTSPCRASRPSRRGSGCSWLWKTTGGGVARRCFLCTLLRRAPTARSRLRLPRSRCPRRAGSSRPATSTL
mmetsp:Transcript_2727/g.11033  ORF Transcript_2727/g.11033 Transcript_2727/m.11033 type:complete len:237 (-) Transcript_2727:995-1705(-)